MEYLKQPEFNSKNSIKIFKFLDYYDNNIIEYSLFEDAIIKLPNSKNYLLLFNKFADKIKKKTKRNLQNNNQYSVSITQVLFQSFYIISKIKIS